MHLALLLVLAASPSWSEAAKSDLAAMHQAIVESHPGPVDDQNPGFKRWLEAGYQQALARAQKAQTFAEYQAALRFYQAGFRDGHLGVRFEESAAPEARWAGFLLAFRDGKFVVKVASPDAGIPVGVEIVECDGQSPRTLMEQRVFPFRGNPALEAHWTRFASELLVERGISETAPLKQCRYRQGSDLRPVTLHYRAIPAAELELKQQAASFGPAPGFGARPLGARGVWVSLPRFGGDETLAPLKQLVSQAPSWRQSDVIVFDVRGNDGGNSAWGDQLLEGLYGKAYVENYLAPKVDPPSEFVEWRVSRANLDYLRGLVKQLSAQLGPKADETREIAQVADSMAPALDRKEPLVREEEVRAASRKMEPPVHARIFVVTDGRCVSACLDFVDAVLALPGAHQVGWPTSADSTYMEIRPVPLPSGQARLSLAIKVYRNRRRGNNEAYVPYPRFDGEISDTVALEQLISKLAAAPLTP